MPEAAARDLAYRLLTAHDVPSADAATITDCLIRADLRGVDTHGITRLPGYLDRVRRGLIAPQVDLAPRQVSPVAMHIDGQNGFGFVIATRAVAEGAQMARDNGIGLVSVYRSTHFGMAASYVLQAVEAGLVALVFTNASPGMPPWGGRTALLGTSPIAAGAPGGQNGDFILDMSPAIAARGKVRRALRQGVDIPEGWAIDEKGRATTDPTAALRGVMLPIAGPKGAGLSMLMDVLGGVLSGAAYAGDVGDMTKNFERPQNVGHFFLIIRPDLYLPADEFRARMDVLTARVRANPLAEGFDEIVVPGELEARLERQRRAAGIPYDSDDLDALAAEAERTGIAALQS